MSHKIRFLLSVFGIWQFMWTNSVFSFCNLRELWSSKSAQIRVCLICWILFRKDMIGTCDYEDIKPEFIFLRENDRLSEII